MKQLFTSICNLASYGLFEVAKQIEEAEQIYDDDELIKLQLSVTKLLDVFIKEVFDGQSAIAESKFCDAVASKSSWVFDPVQIRQKLLELADIEARHFIDQDQLKKKF